MIKKITALSVMCEHVVYKLMLGILNLCEICERGKQKVIAGEEEE